jgi:ER-derived vesicles protein
VVGMVDIFNTHKRKEFLEKAEDFADLFIRKTRRQLPHIARLCLIATFIDDGFRLIFQWHDQVNYISTMWWCAFRAMAMLFLVANIISQFVGSAFVLVRYQVRWGVAILMGTVIVQTFGYGILYGVFLVRNISLCGSLILLFAENQEEKAKSLMAGLPATGENIPQQYLLLTGRVLVVLMFLTLTLFSLHSFVQILLTMVCLCGVLMVAVGYKTKLTALALVVVLTLMNFYYNNFWGVSYGDGSWDFLKYDFFQTWSIIGGLLLIVSYGPGGVSVDDYKKKW